MCSGMCPRLPIESATGLRSRAWLASFLTAAAIGACAAIFPAHAQQAGAPSDEVPIGTFNLGSPPNASPDGFSVVEPPEGFSADRRDSANDGSRRWFFQSWEKPPQKDDSEAVYAEAVRALDSNRMVEAQRLFEALIAETPNSARAAAARQHLGRIYRTVETGSTSDSNRTWPGGQDAAAKSVSLNLSPVLSRTVIQNARVSPSIDGQFLSDAGDRVFFSTGSSDLGTRARGVIQAQARFLIRHPAISAAVEGYADEGTLPDDETIRISQARAAVVRDRLIAEGVAASRLVAYGRGREDRVSNCPAPECLAQNRRVVTVLLDGPVPADAKPQRRADDNTGAGSGSPSQ